MIEACPGGRPHGYEGSLWITVMVTKDMAKKSGPRRSAPAAKRRGRPPKPGGRIPQVEVQRAYRARLAAAGKVVRVVDAVPAPPTNPAPASVSDFDPAKDGIYERKMVEGMRGRLQGALLKLELREQDVARLEQRNAYLEGELKLQERHHTNALKDNIVLKQQLAQARAKRR
jgi:hypothetical protein